MARLDPSTVEKVIVHTSATPPSMDIGVETISRWHRERGWLAIGYHDVIRRDGTHEKGRPIHKPGAHTEGYNLNSVGICLVGGVDEMGDPEDNFTEAQFETLRKLAVSRLRMFGLEPEDLVGHNELAATKCPVFDVEPIRNTLNW